MNYFTNKEIKRLEEKSIVIREDIINMIHTAHAGHPGGSLSAVDIIIALYFHVMNIDPANPKWAERDRFVLSKGHSCPALYAVLAHRGYFDQKELKTLRQHGSILQGHPDMRKTPGVDMTAGSLGHGLSTGVGMALSAKFAKLNYNVYVMLGDGECQEGLVWEAAMTAGHYHLNNLVAIVDYNGLQINGQTNTVMNLEPLDEKFKAFGWSVLEIDGHDYKSILNGFFRASKFNGPVCMIANTVKGKGVSFMENNPGWHGKAPDDAETQQALADIEKEAEA